MEWVLDGAVLFGCLGDGRGGGKNNLDSAMSVRSLPVGSDARVPLISKTQHPDTKPPLASRQSFTMAAAVAVL